MNPTRAQLIALALIVSGLMLVLLLVDWAYARGRSDLYALLLQYRAQADTVLRTCSIPGAH